MNEEEMEILKELSEQSYFGDLPFLLYADLIGKLIANYNKEKEKNKEAYVKANNYLYFADSADYEVALYEVIRSLRPDLKEKWDNGEYDKLEYIKLEEE